MRRGSVNTWEPLARRQSSSMAQFPISRAEFTTSEVGLSDIEYDRKGGFFISHKITAFVISAFFLVIIAAGFVGAYIGSIPNEKAYDTFGIIEEDVGCDHVAPPRFSLCESLSPSRYRIELSPIIKNETITRLRGRATIEFRYDGSESLSSLVLNARHINFTSVTLVSGTIEKSGDFKWRSKRNAVNDEAEIVGNFMPSKESNFTAEETELMTNETVEVFNVNSTLKNMSDESAAHLTNLEDLRDPSIVDEFSPVEQIDSLNSNGTKTFETDAKTAVDSSNATKMVFPSVDPSGELSTNESHVKNETIEILINKREMDEEGGFLVLHPEKPLKNGKYYLEFHYEVPISGYAILATNKSENSSEKWIAASRTNPTILVNFFPAFDDVRKKARFSLTLPRPVNLTIFSNMPLKSDGTSLGEWVMDTFEETPPISPGNLAVAATRRTEAIGKRIIQNTTINFWDYNTSPGTAKYLMDKIEPIFQSLVELFGVNLSVPKLDIIGLQHSDYSIGYPGLVMIQESLYDVKHHSPDVTKEHATINLIKLIGKQWLGGLVNSQNSSDDWILESSLLYLQHRLMKEINPILNYSTFVMDVQPHAFEVDGYSISRSLAAKLNPINANLFYAQEAYAIGACLIRMLHGALRQTEFHAGYKSFVSRWSGGNADVASFWRAMTVNSSADEQPDGKANLPEIMELWSREGGYPVVTVTRNYKTGSAIVHQARFSYDELSSPSTQLWHIPLTWISSFNSTTSLKWIKNQAETTLELESIVAAGVNNKTWVVFNPTKSGYYRVNYDLENWKLLAGALRENHEIFSPVTRASLIDDAFSLGFIRAIPYSVVFDVISYLPGNEREPEPWTYLLHHSVKLNLALYDSPHYFDYKKRMLNFVSDLFDRAGRQINEGSRLTMIAHQLAFLFDYPAYSEWTKENYAGFESLMGLPIKQDVPSYLRNSLLCAFAKLNNELGWQWWEQKFANITNREERNSLLSSLACFQVPSMLQAILNEIVYSNSFDENDALVILDSFSKYPAAAQTALKFVESNWKNITKRYPCKVVSAFLDASSTGFTTKKDIEDYHSFREKNYERLKKFGYVTSLLEAKANASVSFITSLPENPMWQLNDTTFQDTGMAAS